MKKLLMLLMFFSILANAKNLISEQSLVEGMLENGFKYTIKHNTKPKKSASFRLIVKVGSVEEDEDQRGIAHLVEHMAFNGSKNFQGNSLVKFLESLGVNFGSHLNASTSMNETIYMLEVPLEKDNLHKAMLVFSDWANGLEMTKKELEKEKGVVLEEARARNNVEYRIYEQIHKIMYKNTKFEHRLPIGLEKIVKNVSLERVKDFYFTWYQPRFMHFVAVGDFDVKSIEKLINETFSNLKNTNKKNLYRKNIEKNTYINIFKDKEVIKMNASLIFIDDYKKIKNENDYKKEFVLSLIKKLFMLKADELSLEKNPAAKDLNLNISPLGDNLRYFIFQTSFTENNALNAFKQLLNLIEDIKINGFSYKDFELVKKDVLVTNLHELNNAKNRTSSSFANEITYYKANDEIYVDLKYATKLEEELLQKLSLKDINDEFKRFTSIKEKLVFFIVPEIYKVDEENIKKILHEKNGIKKKKVLKTLPNEIETKTLDDKKILFQKHHEDFDFHEIVLENDVKILYKFNDYEKDKVSLKAFSKGGYSLYENDIFFNAKNTAKLINNSGRGKYNFLETKKIQADKIVELTSFIDRYFEGFYGSSSKKDFKYLLKNIYLATKEFKLDKNILFNTKIQMNELINKEKNSPQLTFKREFERFYYKDNPRYKSIEKKDVQKLNEEDVLKIYKDRFSDLNNFTFFIIGDIKKDEVLKWSKKYLANLPTKKRNEIYKDRNIRHIQGTHKFIKNLNNENISNISFIYSFNTPFTTKKEINLIALSDILQTKLMELIREEKSGVYGINVDGYFDKIPNHEVNIKINFSCDPARKEEIKKYVLKTIDEIKNKEVDEKYLKAFIKKSLVYFDEISHTNDFLQALFEKSYKYNEKMISIEEYKKLYKNITTKSILENAKEFFNTKNIIFAELNPK